MLYYLSLEQYEFETMWVWVFVFEYLIFLDNNICINEICIKFSFFYDTTKIQKKLNFKKRKIWNSEL